MAQFRHIKDSKKVLDIPDSDASRIRILEASNRYTRIDQPGPGSKVKAESEVGFGGGTNPATPKKAKAAKKDVAEPVGGGTESVERASRRTELEALPNLKAIKDIATGHGITLKTVGLSKAVAIGAVLDHEFPVK